MAQRKRKERVAKGWRSVGARRAVGGLDGGSSEQTDRMRSSIVWQGKDGGVGGLKIHSYVRSRVRLSEAAAGVGGERARGWQDGTWMCRDAGRGGSRT